MWHTMVQATIAGIANGSVLALFTFGLVLILKATGIINFAHGETATFAAFIAAVYLVPNDVPLPVILLAMMLVGATLAFGIEQLVIRPLREAPEWSIMLATLAVGLFLRALETLTWGSRARPFPYTFGTDIIRFDDHVITRQQVTMIAATVALLSLASWYFLHTRTGIALRAMASSSVGAEIVGARSALLRSLTWICSGAVAGLTGFLSAPITFVAPGMMEHLTLNALAAITLAGLESMPIAVAGALAIGVASEFASIYLPVQFRDLLPFAVVFLALMARPGGITHKAEERAV